MSMIAKNRIHSAWTPLSNEEANKKIFEERVNLVMKWFLKWNEDQRKKLFEELVSISKPRQLEYARELINSRAPCLKDDFTRFLPRAISLYILSFLDARSLCRCAQVCWYWRYLSELDQLWMPKCLHFGWNLSFTPSPYENGVWKRNFIEQFNIIQAILPKKSPVADIRKLKLEKTVKTQKTGPAPWRGSDPVPKDTWRFNYLNNDEVLEQVARLRQKKKYGSLADSIMRNAHSKINTGHHAAHGLTRSHSLTHLSGEDFDTGRPKWAQQTAKSLSSRTAHKDSAREELNKICRPAPVNTPRPISRKSSRPATARSQLDKTASEMFPQAPWKIPDHDDSDENQH